MQPLPGLTHDRFSHLRVRSPLLTESLLFSLPAGTEMFHFPTFPPTRLYIHPAVTHQPNGLACGVSPFGHPGLTVWLSTPPGLSQIPTSFIGSYYQGIHRAPLPTYPTNNPTKQGHQPHKPQIEQIQQPNQRWLPSHRYNHYKTDTPTHNRPACRTLNKMLASTIQLPQQHPTNTNHNPNTGRVNASRNNNLLLKPSPHQ